MWDFAITKVEMCTFEIKCTFSEIRQCNATCNVTIGRLSQQNTFAEEQRGGLTAAGYVILPLDATTKCSFPVGIAGCGNAIPIDLAVF